MHPLRTSRHLLQLLPQPALPEVSGGRSRPLACCTSPGASPHALRPRGLHAASRASATRSAKQEDRLRSAASYQCGDASGNCARSETPGRQIGFFSVLHTWNQKLQLHPHVHCVVPAGGLSADHTRWVSSHHAFFLPVKVLSRVFRGKFVAALQRAFHDGRLSFHGDWKLLAQPKVFASWLRPLFRKDWMVYAKRPFGGPEYVLRYLGRYTHRVAISNHRVVSFADDKVTFRWRDSARNNEQKLLTLSLDEFLRRFLLHVLPKGFVRIRHFGSLANRRRATTLPLCLQLLGSAREPQAQQEVSAASASDLWFCPKCGGPMAAIERFTAAEVRLRSPPLPVTPGARHHASHHETFACLGALHLSVPCRFTSLVLPA